jgi:hypothetical protein
MPSRQSDRRPWRNLALIFAISPPIVLPNAAPGEPEADDVSMIPDEEGTQLEYRLAQQSLNVRWHPRTSGGRRAKIAPGHAVAVVVGSDTKGGGCDDAWLELADGGWICADYTEPADDPPVPVARPLHDGLPFIYAHRAGKPAFSYAFVAIEKDADGAEVYVRPRGTRLSATRYELHEPSDFHGRDLAADPLPEGQVPAWVASDDVPVYASAAEKHAVARLDRHDPLVVTVHAEEEEVVLAIVDGPEGTQGHFVDPEDGVRYWDPLAPPEDIGDDDVWVDIDVRQQMLAVRRGSEPVYVTLISGGTRDRPTPLGLYEVQDKRAYSTMAATPDSSDDYFVEHVPWTIYFRRFYAIHGAYWHDDFGNRRSHGCVNLAPYDARRIYGMLSPHHADGFAMTFADDEHAPGSLVRVRFGETRGPDRR